MLKYNKYIYIRRVIFLSENGLSEFMEYVYKYGAVKDVEEAFEEYNPKNEWHEGKIENVINESSSEYNNYFIGDIVFVKQYYYQDGSEGSNHLFVIIDQNNMAVPIESFGMLISSQIKKSNYDANKLLKKNIQNGLNKDSIVKTDVIYKINNNQILFKIGSIDKERIEEYKESYKKIHLS